MHCQEEELVQQSSAGPLLGEEWLRAVIFLFDAVLRLVFLEMEQVSCEHMLCISVYSKVYSMQALTEQQDESGLSLLNHLTQNRLLGGVPLEQHPIKFLVCI